MGSPRGKLVRKINKVLFELKKSMSLGIDATNLREFDVEEEVVRNKEKGEEKK